MSSKTNRQRGDADGYSQSAEGMKLPQQYYNRGGIKNQMDARKVQQAKSLLDICLRTHFSQVPTNDDGWKALRMRFFEMLDLLEITDRLLQEGLSTEPDDDQNNLICNLINLITD